MAVAHQLTEGAIAKIAAEGATAAEEFKPTVQVTELKQLQTNPPQRDELFRVVLSDGAHLQQVIMDPQINHLVKDGTLRSGSVVRLVQYACVSIEGCKIIIIRELMVVAEERAIIGNPISAQRPSGSVQPSVEQPGNVKANLQSSTTSPGMAIVQNPNLPEPSLQGHRINQVQNNFQPSNYSAPSIPSHPKAEPAAGFSGSASSNSFYGNQNIGLHNSRSEVSPPHVGIYSRPPQSTYQQQPPMYNNREPVTKNEAPARMIPIAALKPNLAGWAIKARVTAKGELRYFYNNLCGEGKVFSFDLLDSEGGEIEVTCFDSVADQFFNQIEVGRVYLISQGSLRPPQKNVNHLRNDLKIHLEQQSKVQPYFDDNSIPRKQFHFRPVSDIESMDNDTFVDVIGVVSSVAPTASLVRKNGNETQKRTLQLKDMSGRSVELTLWGNFCYAEGQSLQNLCDSGGFPVLAVTSCRVREFNGKAVETISSSQLSIDPDFPEAHRLKGWFDKEGRNMLSVSISREVSSMSRMDALKTVSQIKDEKLGTSEKPDWITVNAIVISIKADNFCYPACPIMVGDRPCSKKVINIGDGKWWCEKCDQSVDECDYSYILQFQIEDHTGLTWVTAFQECGAEIMGISAKDLYYMKHQDQDGESFSKILHRVLSTQYMFKLKVKEETFSDKQHVKCTVVKAEKVNCSSHSRFLDQTEKFKLGDGTSSALAAEASYSNAGMDSAGFGDGGAGSNSIGKRGYAGGELVQPENQVGQYGNQYSTMFPGSGASGSYMSCSSCGATGHSSTNCPSIMIAPGQSMGGTYGSRVSPGASYSGASGECFKCQQVGHRARDCPGLKSGPPAYGNSSTSSGRFGGMSKEHIRGF